MRHLLSFFLIGIFTLSQTLYAQSVQTLDSTTYQTLAVLQRQYKQNDSTLHVVVHELGQCKSVINKQSQQINQLQQAHQQLQDSVVALQGRQMQTIAQQATDKAEWTAQINTTNQQVEDSSADLDNRTLYGSIIGGVLLLIVLGLIVWIILLRKKMQAGVSSIDDVRKAQETLANTQLKLQEESVKLDSKLIELAEKQIEQHTATATTLTPTAIDHSLVLKVADEIARIEQNMSHMDSTIKGYRQLARGVQKIKDNFLANGYEIIDMLGKPYKEGMRVIANFSIDESLELGQQIITGITKPQVNYNGKMIQAAQITVSQNI